MCFMPTSMCVGLRVGKLQAAQLECVQRLNGFSVKQRRLKDAEAENFKAKLAKTDQDIQTLHKVCTHTPSRC